MCLPTCEEGGCIHYLNAISICQNHYEHAHLIKEFDDDAVNLQDALMEDCVSTIMLSYGEQLKCEWQNSCSLRYVSRNGENVYTSDDQGNTFLVHISQITSFGDVRDNEDIQITSFEDVSMEGITKEVNCL